MAYSVCSGQSEVSKEGAFTRKYSNQVTVFNSPMV